VGLFLARNMIAGSLEIQMLANLAELRKQMDSAVGMVQGASAQMQKAAELAGKALGLIGVGLSVGAFTGFIRNAINAADALDEMSGRVGVSAKELSGLQLAYRQAGMGNDAMASSIAKLSQEMSQGNVGLRALGVNAKDAAGNLKTPTAVLLELSDKFAKLQDGAGKTALAMEIFGKSGAEMVPLLNSGSEGIREMIEMSERLGLVIEDKAAAQAGQFNDTLELLGLGLQGVGTRIAAQLLPTLNNLTGSFLESMTQGDRLRGVADFLASAMKGLYTVGVGVVEMFNTLGKAAGGGIAAIMAVLQGDFSGAKRILDEAKTDILDGWASTAKAVSKAWSDEGDAAVAAASKIIKTNGDLLAAQKAREEVAKKAAAAAEKEAEKLRKQAEDGAKLIAGLIAQESGLSSDFAEKWAKMNAAYNAGVSSLDELVQAQKNLLAEQPGIKKGIEAEAAAWQAWLAQRKRVADALFDSAESLEAGNKALREEIEMIGLSSEQQEAILRQRRETILLTKEATLAEMERQAAGTNFMSAQHIALAQEIEQLKERNGLLNQKALRERESRGWADFYGSIESTAHSVWTDVANNGMSAFERVGKTIKASVLDVLWQIVGRRWLINIGTSIFGAGFGTAANAATAGANPLGLMLQGTQLYSGLTSGTGMLGTVGNWLGLGSAASAATTGMTAGMSLANPGMAAMINPVTSGAAASGGLSGMLGAIPGWGWALAGVAALAGIFNKKSTPHLGAGSSYSADAGLRSSTDIYASLGFTDTRHYDAGVEVLTAPLAQAVGQTLDSFAVAFGRAAGYEVSTAFADDSSKDGAWGGLRIIQNGRSVLDWGNPDGDKWAGITFADGEQGSKEYLARVAKDVRDVLAEESPGWVSAMLNGLGDAPSMESLSAAVVLIGQAQAAFESFGQFMPTVATLADSAVASLVKASGGVEALTANMSTFVANFFTEGERLEVATANVAAELAKLGFVMPQSREEFKALVQAQWALGDAGADTAAKLLALAGAFAAVTAETVDATAAAQAAAEAMAQEQKQRRVDLLRQLERAIDAERELLEVRRDAIAETVGAISDLSSVLRNSARDLRGTIDTTREMLAVQGRDVIAQALKAALTGGALPGADALTQAISAVRSGIDQGAYGSEFERQRDILVLAGQLEDLGDVTDVQLTIAERQLKGIEAQIDQQDLILNYWRELLDKASGEYEAIVSVAEAIDALRAEMFPDDKSGGVANPGAVGGYTGVQGSGVGTGGGSVVTGRPGYVQLGIDAEIGKYARDNFGTGSVTEVAAIVDWIKGKDWTLNDAAHALNLSASDLQAYLAELGIPAFANGGNHAGGWAWVGERGPELVNLPPARVFTASQSSQMVQGGGVDPWAVIDRLQSELTGMRTAVEEIAENTSALPGYVDQRDQVSEGGNADRVEIMNVDELAGALVKKMETA